MPIIDNNDVLMDSAPGYAPIALPEWYRAQTPTMASPLPDPTSQEIWGASFERENDILAMYDIISRQNETELGDIDPEFDPYGFVVGTQYEPYADLFTKARNKKHAGVIRQRIDRDLENIKILERGGTLGIIAPMVASIASPTTFIPLGQLATAGRLGRAMLTAGRGALKFGAGNMAAAAIQEAILREAQEVRPALESLLNIGAAGVLGGVLGGGISLAGSASLAGQLRRIGALDLDENVRIALQQRLDAMRSEAGAARADLPPIEILGRSTERLAELQANAEVAGVSLGGPNLRSATAPSMVEREVGAMLADTIVATTRNLEGIPSAPRGGSLETRTKMLTAYQGRAYQALLESFNKYRFGQVDPSRMQRMGAAMEGLTGARGDKLTFDQFRKEVSAAMRRGDQHAIPEVAEAAKAQRAELYDPLIDKAIRAQIFKQETIDRLRPTGKSTAGGAKKAGDAERAPAEPVSDPMQRQLLKALLKEAEDVTGSKFIPDDQVDRIIDEIAADEDLYSRLVSAARGESLPFAIDPSSGRIVRADGAVMGKDWYDLVDDVVERGEVVDVHPGVVEKMMDEVVEVQAEMPSSVRDVPHMVMTRAEPVSDGVVRLTFTEAWGFDRTSINVSADFFESFRAAHYGGRILLRASAIGNVVGGVPRRDLLRGQIWHEFVHSRFKVLREAGSIEGLNDPLKRVISHGVDLGYMEQSVSSYMRQIRDVTAEAVGEDSGRLIDSYDELYSGPEYRSMKEYYVAEEIVAHMMELRSHGVLRDNVELAPILDDLKLVLGEDLPPQRLAGAADDVEQMGTPFDNINAFAERSDVNPSLLKSAALRSFVDVAPDDFRLANQIVELELDDLDVGRIQVEMPAGEAFRMIDRRLKGINQLIGCLS